MGTEDRQLVEKAKAGDEAAFRSLFDMYGRRVLSVVYGVLRNHEQAQEVTQEAFIKAYRNLHLFQQTSSFYTWLYRIAVNTAIDARRKKGFGLGELFDEEVEKEESQDYQALVSAIPRPDIAVEGKEIIAKLQSLLDQLPENQRLAVTLKDVEELSYQEIAEIMECSIGTVMSRIHYGRKRLQELIKRKNNDRESD